ncbi:MAG: hypothetical protein WA294_20265 [Acidobacteriaceae bacterium]
MSDEMEELQKRAEALTPKYQEVSFRSFLEEIPPDTYVRLIDIEAEIGSPLRFKTPDITLFCEGKDCAGVRIFRTKDSIYHSEGWSQKFLLYTCRNCGASSTTFAIRYHIVHGNSDPQWRALFLKIGQVPAFGPQTPARLISLIGPDREIFLQGRRSETRGMGIGAFAYYRRVVENQKNRIIAEIARVAKTLGSTAEVDALFKAAMKETRFSESLAMVKDVIPQTLMISGQNPLTLLHSALSKGLHDESMTDQRCLQLAQASAQFSPNSPSAQRRLSRATRTSSQL